MKKLSLRRFTILFFLFCVPIGALINYAIAAAAALNPANSSGLTHSMWKANTAYQPWSAWTKSRAGYPSSVAEIVGWAHTHRWQCNQLFETAPNFLPAPLAPTIQEAASNENTDTISPASLEFFEPMPDDWEPNYHLSVLECGWPCRSMLIAKGAESAGSFVWDITAPGVFGRLERGYSSRLGAALRAWPLRPKIGGFVINTLLYASVVLVGFGGIGHIRQSRRRRANLCLRCAYSLAGLPPNSTCPECGKVQHTVVSP